MRLYILPIPIHQIVFLGQSLELPNVQQKIGEMEYELTISRQLLYSIARLWDEADEEERKKLIPNLGVTENGCDE